MSEKEVKKIYIHDYKMDHRMNEERELVEEFLRDGPKGISFKALKKIAGKKNSFVKISGKELEDGNFGITIKIEDNAEQKTVSKKDLMALIKKHKELAFLEKYMTKEMDKFRKTLKGGSYKKKSSKKRDLYHQRPSLL